MQRPVIGIIPLVDEERESYWMLPGYMRSVSEAGGFPVMLPLETDRAALEQAAEMCDGLLFTGGHDVSPRLYGEMPLTQCGECCEARDKMESDLLELALAADKSVFGICRGLQFINAALGGTLYQDLPTQLPSDVTHRQSPPYDQNAHSVELLPSPLLDLLGERKIGVNSYHHQAVKTLAPELKATARSSDGIIEAAYMPNKRFVWAVQWHPEFSFERDKNSRKLFERFVSEARRAGK